jgi:hypothetical protein
MPPSANPLLLAYTLSSVPSPLGAGETGTATLSVAPIVAPVYCDTVILSVKIGTDDGCLFATPPAASVSSADWTHDPVKIVQGADIGLGDGTYASYTFSTDNPGVYLINYPLSFSLEGLMAPIPGDFSIAITEQAGTTSDPSSFTTNQGSAPISTSNPDFYLSNFIASVVGTPTVPCTQFANGASIVFSWESNGSSFSLYRKNETTPFWSGTATTTTLTAGPSTDTTFILQATSTTSARSREGAPEATQLLYDALTITISNPDLTPNSVQATANVAVGGTLNVTSNVTVGGTVNVATIAATGTNPIQINGSGLAVNGSASVTTDFTATGQGSFGGNVTVGGTLNVETLYNADPNNYLAVRGFGLGVYGSMGISDSLGVMGNCTFAGVTADDITIQEGTLTAESITGSGSYAMMANCANGFCISGNGGVTGCFTINGPLYARGGIYDSSVTLVHTSPGGEHVTVTSPVSRRPEVHLSGTAQLVDGRATVSFEQAGRNMIARGARYQVMLTPAEECEGVCAVNRTADGFTVKELRGGRSTTEVDWFVIAPRSKSGGNGEADELVAPEVAMNPPMLALPPGVDPRNA